MKNFKIEAPWYEFNKKVKALFDRDPDITVGDLVEADDGRTNYVFDIEVRNHKKFIALDRALPKTKTFGNITVGIIVYDEENLSAFEDAVETYKTIFEGNPIVKDIKDVTDFAGTRHGFVRFKPEVIQFFHDDISDYDGRWSGLAQDIAKEVFEGEYRGIHFCTAGVDEPEDGVGKPLGEWP